MEKINTGEYATARAASAAGTIMVYYYICHKMFFIQNKTLNLLFHGFVDTFFMGYFQR